MKDLIRHPKRILSFFTGGIRVDRPQLSYFLEPVEQPDAEVKISKDILNELLNQNFPLKGSLSIGTEKEVRFSVEGAELEMKPGNQVELRVTKAAIHYNQTLFKIGLRSNIVAATLHVGVVSKEGDFRLLGHGWFSEFHIKYLPRWVGARIAETLASRFFSPLLDISVNSFLSFDQSFDADVVEFKASLKPEAVSAKITKNGLKLQVRFAKTGRPASDPHLTNQRPS